MSFRSYQKELKKRAEEKAVLDSLQQAVESFRLRKNQCITQAKDAKRAGDNQRYEMHIAAAQTAAFQEAQAYDMLTNYQAACGLLQMGNLSATYVRTMDRMMRDLSKVSRGIDAKKSGKLFMRGVRDSQTTSQQLRDMLKNNGQVYSDAASQLATPEGTEEIRRAVERELAQESEAVDSWLTDMEGAFGASQAEVPPVATPAAMGGNGVGAPTPPPQAAPAEVSPPAFVEDEPTPAPAPAPAPDVPPTPDVTEPPEEKPAEDDDRPMVLATKGGSGWKLPPLYLLEDHEANGEEHEANKQALDEVINVLLKKLRHFDISAEVVNVIIGASFSRIEMKLGDDIPISRVAAIKDDIALAVKRPTRLLLPIEGKDLIGVEVMNEKRETVYLKEFLRESPPQPEKDGVHTIDIGLGFDLGRQPHYAPLASLPHLLVGGSAGSGKSCYLRSMVMGLLFRYTPDEIQLMLIDFKRVEWHGFEGIPHVIGGKIVEEYDEAVEALDMLVEESDRRYRMYAKAKVRNIDEYNAICEPSMRQPKIICIIDEYADIIGSSYAKQYELDVMRLAQKSRASGIHLVVATQRPSVKVINGVIKANFSARIAFRVASWQDSMNILDATGGDKLLGDGDMLFAFNGKVERMQAPFISGAETDLVLQYLRGGDE